MRVQPDGMRLSSPDMEREKPYKALDPSAFAAMSREPDVVLLDTRDVTEFTAGFVPGSISIGLEGRFADWASQVLPEDARLLLVTDPGRESESVRELNKAGFTEVLGVLEGGYPAWKEAGYPVDMIINVEAGEMAMDLPYDDKLVVLDVREELEYDAGHVVGAQLMPLSTLKDPATISYLEEEMNLYIHCRSGYRSVIAASMLKRQGYHNLRNVTGGWNSISAEPNIPVEVKKSTLN